MSHQVLRNDQPGSSSATGLVGGRGIDEHRRLFQPSRLYNRRTGGKGKGPSSENPTVKKARKQNTCTYWKKNSFCLSSCDQVLKPNPQQRIQLARFGLKTKVLLFEEGGTAHHVHNVITQEYPVLESCGGYSLLRLAENSHNLVEIEDPLDVLIDVEYLKNILNNATLYIRPLQRDISPDDMKQLTLTEVLEEAPSELCHSCGLTFTLPELRKHVVVCKEDSKSKQTSPDSPPYEIYQIDHSSDDESIEDALLDHAIQLSRCTNTSKCDEQYKFQEVNFRSVVLDLMKNTSDELFLMPVRRAHVLEDAIRSMERNSFAPEFQLNVQFLGEEAEDGGGPRREFWACVAKEVSGCFEGEMNRKVPMNDVIGLQQGSGFPYMAQPVYDYISGVELSEVNLSIEDIPSFELRTIVEKVQNSSTNNELQSVCETYVDVIVDSGYTLPLREIRISSKHILIRTIILYATVLKNKAVLDQLKSGLSCLGVLGAITKNPKVFESFFVKGKTTLTADMITRMLKPRYSDKGSTERIKEEATFMLFLDLLHECEDNEDCEVMLTEVLSFFSGAEYPPPLGFDVDPSVGFSNLEYPTASTCALELTLPTKHHDKPLVFREKMIYALKNHGGFGLR